MSRRPALWDTAGSLYRRKNSSQRKADRDDVGDKLNKVAKELYGIENFTDMICDETIAVDVEEVINFLTEKNHPALTMQEIM